MASVTATLTAVEQVVSVLGQRVLLGPDPSSVPGLCALSGSGQARELGTKGFERVLAKEA